MTETTETTDIKPMTDEECLKLFLNLLNDRVTIKTGFIPDEESGLLTKQLLYVICGEYAVASDPEDLEHPLMLASPKDTGDTIN